MRRRRRRDGLLRYVIAFALGLLACWLLPPRFLVAMLVVALLICCFFCNRC